MSRHRPDMLIDLHFGGCMEQFGPLHLLEMKARNCIMTRTFPYLVLCHLLNMHYVPVE